MKQEQTYHIDVTPEEDTLFKDNIKPKVAEKLLPNTFKKVFCLVLGVHVLVGAAVVLSSTTAKATSNKQINFTDPIAEIPQTTQKVETTEPVVAKQVTPTSTPVQQTAPKPKETQQTAQEPSVSKSVHQNNEKFVKEYTIKQGDTITSIAKKYRLSTQRLIKINNIKDVNKIQVGQKLKFM